MKLERQKPMAVSPYGRFHPILTWFRRDAVVLLLYLLLTVALTWPLTENLGGSWLATRDNDTFVKLWDQWWLQRYLDTNQSLLYTTDLFIRLGWICLITALAGQSPRYLGCWPLCLAKLMPTISPFCGLCSQQPMPLSCSYSIC